MMNDQEQSLAEIRDALPPLWYAIYSGSVQAGFDETQAFILLQTWIIAQNPNGSRPPNGSGPKLEE